ncbi:hypothetical protein KR074_000396 [Drosophila pseudoananassae]|nr:hypothetical protein KR074_000396 [Drosophila pseudoananassae]
MGDRYIRYQAFKSKFSSPPAKAMRVCFLRNKDKFFRGVTVSISRVFYRDMKTLKQGITETLRQHVRMPSVISNFCRIDGSRLECIEDFMEGDIVICCCRYEAFVPMKYAVNSVFLKLLNTLIRWEESRGGGDVSGPGRLHQTTTMYVEQLRSSSSRCTHSLWSGESRFSLL